MTAGILYLSYDGMLEPLGQSQVLAYLKAIAKAQGRRIHLVSYEKPADWADAVSREAIAAEIARAGIVWHPLRYHRRPSALATAWDILVGSVVGWWLTCRHGLRIVHARSYVPSVMALAICRLTKAKYVFDMRGFWADERIEGGIWRPGGRMYKTAKWFERRFLVAADHVVTLTHAASRELLALGYFAGRPGALTMIPTCADLARFKPMEPEDCEPEFVLGYVGSVGTWYLFDEVLACFAILRRLCPGAKLLVLNRGQHGYVRERLAATSIAPACVEIREVAHAEIAQQIARMDAGILFYRPTYSKLGTAPTRLAEFLGCGVPCLGNAGVGDMAEVLERDRVGVTLRAFTPERMEAALNALLELARDPGTRARCVAVARSGFSLESGVQRYCSIYQSLDRCPGPCASQ